MFDLVLLASPPVHNLGSSSIAPLHDPDYRDSFASSLFLEPSSGFSLLRFQRSAGEESSRDLSASCRMSFEEIKDGGVLFSPYSGRA